MRKKSDTYVLHVFQKKAKHGIATSKRDLNLIRTRLEQAPRLHAENEGALPMGTTRRRIKVTEGSGNIFADVGIARPEEYLAKAELARQIVGALDARRVTQAEAARILGVNQPKVSALRNGRLDGFSTERLFRFLNALGRDVRIVVSPKPRSRRRARLTVGAA